MARVFVGISGWTYEPWRGEFYPHGLPQNRELDFAARRFNALEVNGTFYSLQRPSSFAAWYEAAPTGFTFALKGGRYLTHLRRLRDPRTPLANYFASGPLALREKLGPILWQFPPQFAFDPDRFEAFFDLLPRDTVDAARLARGHDAWMKGRVHLETDARRPLRHAVEFRHESFRDPRWFELLRRYGVASVVADVAGKFPVAHDVTTDWVYVRLHGSRRLYVSGYTPREIRAWADRVAAWRDGEEPADAERVGREAPPAPAGRDVYVFFDNTDVKLRAPVDARRLAAALGVGPGGTARDVLRDLGIDPRRAGPAPTREERARATRRRIAARRPSPWPTRPAAEAAGPSPARVRRRSSARTAP
ncbi:MAG TPA: DUF72 domain-containing protein [Planctomycetota bacterium]|nr:DUF72 domain-containing protein [Planctomycetota bacterium]